MAVRFNAVVIQNPQRQNRYAIKKRQTTGRVAGGELFVYDKGVTTYELILEFNGLRDSEKDDLETFYDTTADGLENTFTYTDHEGGVWVARFLDTELIFVEIEDKWKQDDDFATGGATVPSTIRQEPFWNARIRLEVVAP